MRSTTTLPVMLLAMLVGFAIALPTSDAAERSMEMKREAMIQAPTLVGLYVCTDADWKGECEDLMRGPGLCINLPDKFAGKVSSVGPDSTVSGCTLFQKQGCAGEKLEGLMKPGESNLGLSPQGGMYNDYFYSYICY